MEDQSTRKLSSMGTGVDAFVMKKTVTPIEECIINLLGLGLGLGLC